MNIVPASYHIEDDLHGPTILKKLERCIRTCYKSEDKITDGPESAIKIVKHILSNNHESTLEHVSFTVRFVVDRGISHELVRHRLSSFSQESTRYCDYSGGKYGRQITVVWPCWLGPIKNITFPHYSSDEMTWVGAMRQSEDSYFGLLMSGWKPEHARSVLPNSLKTELVVTANLRQWRLILKQRTSAAAHPQVREVCTPLLKKLRTIIPFVFNDIEGVECNEPR